MGVSSISTPPRTDFPPHFTPSRRPPSGSPPAFRNPSEWRTPDDKPICFYCHRIGHISRHCRSRWGSPAQNFPPSFNNRPAPRSATSPGHFAPPAHYTPPAHFAPQAYSSHQDHFAPHDPHYSRSPSPHRRQSRSPQPRRPPSPAPPRRSPTEN
ncbi:uncharacterized protein LOC119391829 [Rhipicephalus sanguineus]|uniref:uncharacterized protein LOC119391829 n=1 Tax=Rhipicephalus sanguineus TaxID=34632 RepID=UPI001895FB4F|nr:uncharacterized protein LOC119391829 [Rhipicephalus sanguineus]